jgi:hypothetical protein
MTFICQIPDVSKCLRIDLYAFKNWQHCSSVISITFFHILASSGMNLNEASGLLAILFSCPAKGIAKKYAPCEARTRDLQIMRLTLFQLSQEDSDKFYFLWKEFPNTKFTHQSFGK